MVVMLANPGIANLVVFIVLALVGVGAWYFMRRNLRGIDFDETPVEPHHHGRGRGGQTEGEDDGPPRH